MNDYVVGKAKNPARHKMNQLRKEMLTPCEKQQKRKKVSFRMKEKTIIEEIHVVEACREMFKKEILTLGQEVIKFRQSGEEELARYKERFKLEKSKNTSINDGMQDSNIEETNNVMRSEPPDVTKKWNEKLNNLQEDMEHLAKRQSQLDREGVLLDKEEKLYDRKSELEEYENEIEEIESGLDRRQAMCQKRQGDLLALEEELDELKLALESKKENLNRLGVDSADVKNRAKQNWEQVKKSLLEKQSFLQKKVDQYRTDLASLKSTCTAKDICIEKLQAQVRELEEISAKKDNKIEQLDTRLTLMLESEAKSTKKPLSRDNSFQSKSTRRQQSIVRQSSKDFKEKDQIDELPDFKRNSARHPMRQSIDITGTKFQMGIKPPSSEESRACSIM